MKRGKKMESIIMVDSVLSPARVEIPRIPLAPRLDTLEGKTIAFYDNKKNTGIFIHPVIEKFLKEQGVKEVKLVQPHLGSGVHRQPESVIAQFTSADAAVLASAECGSCTAWLCVLAVELERRGVPTVSFATKGFAKMFKNICAAYGFPYMPFVYLELKAEHPMIIRRDTEKVLDEVSHILQSPAEELQKEYESKHIT